MLPKRKPSTHIERQPKTSAVEIMMTRLGVEDDSEEMEMRDVKLAVISSTKYSIHRVLTTLF